MEINFGWGCSRQYYLALVVGDTSLGFGRIWVKAIAFVNTCRSRWSKVRVAGTLERLRPSPHAPKSPWLLLHIDVPDTVKSVYSSTGVVTAKYPRFDRPHIAIAIAIGIAIEYQ